MLNSMKSSSHYVLS